MMNKEHTCKMFDGELDNLHYLVLEMAGLVINQFDIVLQALHDKAPDLATKVIVRDREIDNYEIKIDHEILTVLAKRSPVANDLRLVIALSKIVLNLELIGDEIVKIGKLTLLLINKNSTELNQQQLRDIIKMGQMISEILKQIILSFDNCDLPGAYQLLNEKWDYTEEFRVNIHKQLTFIIENPQVIDRSLHIFQIMKSLEYCFEHCRSINEYLIFIFDGRNIRHRYK